MATDVTTQVPDRLESIRSGRAEPVVIARGVLVREFAGKSCGAQRFSTGSATFEPRAVLPYHTHPISEAITVISGMARVAIEGRRYLLQPFDSVHIPREVAHEVCNPSATSDLVALSVFASAEPTRQEVQANFAIIEKGLTKPLPGDPESLVRFAEAELYELSPGAQFRDLFAGRLGSVGICGGYGRFLPESSLPCHTHLYDESITIVEGEAVCLVKGSHYSLSNCDTAVVPEGRPHRFLNLSASPMAMLWVYAG
ncbi:MAG: cupin domain-containing protein, partial [Candidatus Sulfotelmatobacter sp.]